MKKRLHWKNEVCHDKKSEWKSYGNSGANAGGKGAVEISPLFEKGEYKGKARLIAQITLNPGCSIGEHAHEGEDEIYFFISGKGIVNDNGVIHEVTAGDSVLTGNGAYHSVENTGDEPLVLMAVIILYE